MTWSFEMQGLIKTADATKPATPSNPHVSGPKNAPKKSTMSSQSSFGKVRSGDKITTPGANTSTKAKNFAHNTKNRANKVVGAVGKKWSGLGTKSKIGVAGTAAVGAAGLGALAGKLTDDDKDD
jgi:hypothetical protein